MESRKALTWKEDVKDWKGFYKLMKNPYYRSMALTDLFGPLLCKVVGHRTYRREDWPENIKACKTCGRYIS